MFEPGLLTSWLTGGLVSDRRIPAEFATADLASDVTGAGAAARLFGEMMDAVKPKTGGGDSGPAPATPPTTVVDDIRVLRMLTTPISNRPLDDLWTLPASEHESSEVPADFDPAATVPAAIIAFVELVPIARTPELAIVELLPIARTPELDEPITAAPQPLDIPEPEPRDVGPYLVRPVRPARPAAALSLDATVDVDHTNPVVEAALEIDHAVDASPRRRIAAQAPVPPPGFPARVIALPARPAAAMSSTPALIGLDSPAMVPPPFVVLRQPLAPSRPGWVPFVMPGASMGSHPIFVTRPAQVASRTPVTVPERTVNQIVQTIRLAWTERSGEAHIRLDPQHFGGLSVSLKVDGTAVVARLHADAPAVREWLQTHQHVLKASLAGHDLQLERFEIVQDEPRAFARREAERERQASQDLPRRRSRHAFERRVFEVTA